MEGTSVNAVELVLLLLLAFVVLFGTIAQRINTPYPILLVMAGLALGSIPHMPQVALNPDVIFLVFLPPLLFAAGWNTSWRDFTFHISSILLLAFGLVGFTIIGVGLMASHVFKGFDWRTGMLLGAVNASTDAIAATAIFRRVGLPRRIVDILEGESLVNDASGLLALEFAIAMVVTGNTPSFGWGFLRLLYMIGMGIGLGLLIGVLVSWLEKHIDDAPIEITISILVPYLAYLAGNAVQSSGVFAVATCGLYLSRKSVDFYSPQVRIEISAVWSSLTFLLNGVVFILIGLQLPVVLAGIKGIGPGELLRYALLISVIVIGLRLLWIYPGAYLAYLIRRHIQKQTEGFAPPQQLFVIGWSGMRGVLALAAALSLPQTVANGSPFPQRNLIIFLTFVVIFVTLVLQGLTLPSLIRALGLSGSEENSCEEEEARRLVLEEAISQIDRLRAADDDRFAKVYDSVARNYRHRLLAVTGEFEGEEESAEHIDRYRDVKRLLLDIERRAAVRLRDERRISDDVLRTIERELDLSVVRLK